MPEIIKLIETRAKAAVDAIVKDLDRRGLSQRDQMDGGIKDEITTFWTNIVIDKFIK